VLCAQVVLGVCRLGVLSVLLSDTLVSGFTTGAAVHVLTSQVKNLLGIKVPRHSGPLKIVYVSFGMGILFSVSFVDVCMAYYHICQ
jgi:MFS superfamily sulfate permease-like transporter